MAGENEGRGSLAGRFFKKGDPVLDKVEISEYSLEEVCEIEFALADNSFANIYHRDLQHRDRLEQKIRDDRAIRGSLSGDEHPASILGPNNFTQDWKKQKEAARRSYYEPDDDEASADAKSLLSSSQVSIFGDQGEDTDSAADHDLPSVQQENLSPTGSEHSDSASANEGPLESEGSDGFRPMTPSSLSAPLSQEAQQQGDPVAAANQDAGQSQIEGEGQQLEHIKESFHAVSHNQQYNVEPLVAHPEAASDPQPLVHGHANAHAQAQSPLAQMKHEPEREQVAPGITPEELAQAEQEAKIAGFNEGIDKAEQQFGELAAQMQQSIVDVEGLKEQLLNNSRQNFMAIAKAMVGSILQKHIALNPEALDQLITRAIKESVKSDTFTVKVHPTTHGQLKEVSQLADKLAADDSVAEGHFKVESDLSVVDGNLDHIISSLLDDVDMELFTDEAS